MNITSLRFSIGFIAAFVIGLAIGNYRSGPLYVVDTIDANMALFVETWELLDEYYEGEVPSNEDRIRGAVAGLVRSYGDPHSVFLEPTLATQFEENTQGNFGGVGMEIDIRDELLIVVAPLKNTPAEAAGLRAGDVIIGIDGDSTADLSVDAAVQLIRGEIGTPVELTILREEEELFDVTIVRDVISIPTLEHEIVGDVFVLHLFNFSGHAVVDFEKALEAYVVSGKTKLILDMRGNPGGYLDAAIDISSFFVAAGQPVVYEIGQGEEIVHRSKGFDIGIPDTTEMVVLVDAGSASASEIVAGALSEYDIATLVGTQTFGKGSVQQVLGLRSDDNSLLKVTTAQWYTPHKISISENGLTPDIEVQYIFDSEDPDADNQLDRALEILTQ